jgi:CheY-like chemotaxis protein
MDTLRPKTKARYHILVAEDSPLNQRLAQALLREHGYSVTVVNNGKEAVAAILQGRFDAVLMDVEMPELDGLSATRVIREKERRQGRRVPIVAVTSQDNSAECLQAGMDAYLPKPLAPEPLRRTLSRVLKPAAA